MKDPRIDLCILERVRDNPGETAHQIAEALGTQPGLTMSLLCMLGCDGHVEMKRDAQGCATWHVTPVIPKPILGDV